VAKLAASHIDQLYLSQPVDIRFTATAGDQIPRIPGEISGISAGALTDPQTGAPYFRIDVTFEATASAQLTPPIDGFTGMPVDLYIQTSRQPAWAYLAKPFLNYFSRALRES
jgi:HlyD family secretion protein